jgi:hypothetical protein
MEGSINRTPQILKDLEEKGGVKILNTKEDIEALRRLNERMQEVGRESKLKLALSERDAWNVISD